MKRLVALGSAGLALALGCGGLLPWSTSTPQGATLTVAWPGADPPSVEDAVTVPLEHALMGMPGVQRVEARSSESTAAVTAWFEPGQDTRGATLAALLDRARSLEGTLPEDSDPPMLSIAGAEQRVLTRLAIAGEGWQGCAQVLARQLETVPGVVELRSHRAATRLALRADPDRLAAMGLALQELAAAVAVAEVQRPEVLGDLALTTRTGAALRVADVADLVIEPDPDAGQTLFEGRPGALLTVIHTPGASPSDASRALDQALPRAVGQCAPGVGMARIDPGPGTLLLTFERPTGTWDESSLRQIGATVAAITPAEQVLVTGWPPPGEGLGPDPARAALLLQSREPFSAASVQRVVEALAAQPAWHLTGWDGPGAHASVLIRAEAQDPLPAVAEAILEALARAGIEATVDGLPRATPELTIQPDRPALAAMGIGLTQLHQALRAATSCLDVGDVPQSGERLPLVLCSGHGGASVDALVQLPLRGASGVTVPLGALATLEQRPGATDRLRIDGRPALRLAIASAAHEQAALLRALRATLSDVALPAGVSVEIEE